MNRHSVSSLTQRTTHPTIGRDIRSPVTKPIQAINRYKADLREYMFLLFEQFGLGELLGKAPFDAGGEEEVKTSFSECYRFAREVLGPLNVIGDVEGCKLEGGKVQTPRGFKDAWNK